MNTPAQAVLYFADESDCVASEFGLAEWGWHSRVARSRKRNDLFGSIQSTLAKRRVSHPKTLSRDWWKDASLKDREKALKKSYGFKARDAKFLADSSFSDVFGDRSSNPRVFPGNLPPIQIDALRKLVEKKQMAKKKRGSKKKRNPRKGKMPAGLKKYWARKRRAKNARKRRNPRRRTRTVVKYKYRTRVVKVRARRRRKSNPRPSVRKIYAPKGLSAKGLQQFRRTVARLTGKRTRIVNR